jgi:hypothetical protein
MNKNIVIGFILGVAVTLSALVSLIMIKGGV